MRYVFTYISTLLPLILCDGLWLLVFAKKFYADRMGFLFQQSVQVVPVMVFYPLYAFAIVMLAVLPALSHASWSEALWRGALLGLAAYGAYDLTNHATIGNWPISVTIVDMLWGVFVTAVTSVVAFGILRHFS